MTITQLTYNRSVQNKSGILRKFSVGAAILCGLAACESHTNNEAKYSLVTYVPAKNCLTHKGVTNPVEYSENKSEYAREITGQRMDGTTAYVVYDLDRKLVDAGPSAVTLKKATEEQRHHFTAMAECIRPILDQALSDFPHYYAPTGL